MRTMCGQNISAAMISTQIIRIYVLLLFILQTVYLFPNNSSMKYVSSQSTELLIPCEEGWMLFGQRCYRQFGSRKSASLSWQNASDQCFRLGGKLASIHSKEEHDFLAVNFMLQEEVNVWIGLRDINHDGKYEWEDGSEVNFTFWTPGRPVLSKHYNSRTGCVELRPGKHFYHHPAQWSDVPCSNLQPYICQKERNESLKSSDPLFCSTEEGEGWRFGKSCYNLVIDKRSWDTAELFCQENFSGHLVTISDFRVDWFLDYLLRNFHQLIWIGIKLQNTIQQKWSSGWNVAYNLPYGIMSNFHDVLCIAKHHGQHPYWRSIPCNQAHSFICETSKEHPPMMKESLEGWKCPHSSNEWRDLGGDLCYYFDTESHKQWHEANTECNRRGGGLASIHSKVENRALHPFVKDTQPSLYIGLRSLKDKVTWSDGTSLDFTHWEEGKSSSAKEVCVELKTSNMKWRNVSCLERRGFICSTKKVSPHDDRTGEKNHHSHSCQSPITFKTLVGPICFTILSIVFVVAIIYFVRPCLEEKRKIFTSCLVKTPTARDKMHLLRER